MGEYLEKRRSGKLFEAMKAASAAEDAAKECQVLQKSKKRCGRTVLQERSRKIK